MSNNNTKPQTRDPDSKKRPRTEAQRRASRENGKKSRGPKTSAGKARSSVNAFKDGLFSDKVAPWLSGDHGRRVELLAQLNAEFNPQTPTDRSTVDQLSAELVKITAYTEMVQTLIEADTAAPDTDDTGVALDNLRRAAQTLRELIEAPGIAPKDVTLSFVGTAIQDAGANGDAPTQKLIATLHGGHLSDDVDERLEFLRQAEVAVHAHAERIIQIERERFDDHRRHRAEQMNELEKIAKIEQQITRATKRVAMLVRQLGKDTQGNAPQAGDYIVTAQTL